MYNAIRVYTTCYSGANANVKPADPDEEGTPLYELTINHQLVASADLEQLSAYFRQLADELNEKDPNLKSGEAN